MWTSQAMLLPTDVPGQTITMTMKTMTMTMITTMTMKTMTMTMIMGTDMQETDGEHSDIANADQLSWVIK